MLQILVLCLALCMDEFVASIAYGAGGISINWKETGVMNGYMQRLSGRCLVFRYRSSGNRSGGSDEGSMLYQSFHSWGNPAC